MKDRTIPGTHAENLCKVSGVHDESDLSDEIIHAYWEARGTYSRIGMHNMPLDVFPIIALMAGAGAWKTAKTFKDEIDKETVSRDDLIAVKHRGDWHYAHYMRYRPVENVVVAVMLDDGGEEREFSCINVRHLTEEEIEDAKIGA